MVVYPVGAVGGDFPLPDRHRHLERVDREAAGLERLPPMGRSGHHHDGGAQITKYRGEWFRAGMLGATEVQTVRTSGDEELGGAFALTSDGHR